MSDRRRMYRAIPLAGIALALFATACGNDAGPTQSNSPLLDVVDGTPGFGVLVCKVGPIGTYNFTVSATGGSGWTYPNGQNVTVTVLTANSDPTEYCTAAWMHGNDPTTAGTTDVTVTEVVPSNMHVDSILVHPVPPGGLIPYYNTDHVTVTVGYYQSAHTKFFNSLNPVCTDENASNFGGPLPCVYPPKYCSYTPGGWGAPPSGGNIAALLTSKFSTVYPTGVSVGNSGNYHATFTTAGAVTVYLPAGGTPGSLSHNYTNTASRTEAGEFLDQVLALKFNVNFSAAGLIKPGFNTATVASGPLAGLTTTQALSLANSALGGTTSVLGPYGINVAQLTTILGAINGNNDGCLVDNGYLN